MFKQTACLTFEKYGSTISNFPSNILTSKDKIFLKLKSKSIDNLFISSEDTYVRLIKGVILIVVSDNLSGINLNSYILNKQILLKKGTFYNFIPISKDCQLELYLDNKSTNYISLENTYTYNEVIPTISIDKIYTKFYQEKPVNYLFKGEKHYFWELTFVDRGVLYTNVDGIEFKLQQGDILFYSPNQYHSQYTDENKSCSYLTLSFDMNFEDIGLLSNKVFTCNKKLHSIMYSLMDELHSDNLYKNELIICHLKQLILTILSMNIEKSLIKPKNRVQQFYDDTLLDDILKFINKNIYENINIRIVCDEFNISTSKLHLLFRSNLDTTPKAYINTLKLKIGKELIKDSKYSISEISNILGFNSIHYFSNTFKKAYGFSPTEYLRSVNINN
ncbi:AraC family transcriptional regulator [Clostridium sp. CCUG 7971]|uniref:AraC family transcriptional regulator n=1 Tax=Clostridium sp. CCUG 7971 TaxID=2811414 RepID=UPI001ABB7602|nr:AraC family transcriptional regulator [Clostridium sp. CCUG 7971]MBO3446273.1 AraC family transcriptional regulator [Clostridium sp. CCUG 7971]